MMSSRSPSSDAILLRVFHRGPGDDGAVEEDTAALLPEHLAGEGGKERAVDAPGERDQHRAMLPDRCEKGLLFSGNTHDGITN